MLILLIIKPVPPCKTSSKADINFISGLCCNWFVVRWVTLCCCFRFSSIQIWPHCPLVSLSISLRLSVAYLDFTEVDWTFFHSMYLSQFGYALSCWVKCLPNWPPSRLARKSIFHLWWWILVVLYLKSSACGNRWDESA